MTRSVRNFAINQGFLEEKPWRTWQKHQRVASKRLSSESDLKSDVVDVDFSRFTPQKYLLSHATIVGGVEPEPNGFYIRPAHSNWVNDNGNAWLNQVLLESYKSFIWAENYLEHIQVKEFSKGKILDAVAWIVREKFGGESVPIPTVFVDILVATDRRHHDLVRKIQAKKLNTLSMGCDISHSQCSRCGEIFEEGVDDSCNHIRTQLGSFFSGKDGKKHRQAELCGVPGKTNSCLFKEASWVGIPAFKHAIKHNHLLIGDRRLGTPIKAKVPMSRYKEASQEKD
jgi:hypothetical protein